MLGHGFLGTRADVLMDIVIVSLVAILPILWWSNRLAKQRNYARHRLVQVVLTVTLAVVVFVFELDMRLAGGIFEMTADSRYAGSLLLDATIWGHTVLAIFTSILWLWLVIVSWRRFGQPPAPGAFSSRHRLWGRVGMWSMALTGITGLVLYVLGFAL